MNKNILFVLKDFPLGGGVEKVSMNLAYQFKSDGHKVSFFIMDGTGIPVQLANDFEVVTGTKSGLKGILSQLPTLLRFIKNGHYQAVIAAKEQANILTFLASLLNRNFTPIYTRHCAFDVSDQELSEKTIQRLYRFYSKGRGKIVAVSEDLSKYIQLQIPSASEHIHFCPNPVVNQELLDKGEKNSDDFNHPNPYFCAVGRLCEQKGFDLLLQSYAMALLIEPTLPDLVIVGDGELKESLIKQAKELCIIDRVKFNGFTKNPYFIVNNAEMFLLSSRHEGLPTVLIEALALQKKIVAFDCPTGPREILKDGEYGSLVPAQDISLFAEAMVKVFNTNKIIPSEAIEPYTYPKSAASYLSLMDKS